MSLLYNHNYYHYGYDIPLSHYCSTGTDLKTERLGTATDVPPALEAVVELPALAAHPQHAWRAEVVPKNGGCLTIKDVDLSIKNGDRSIKNAVLSIKHVDLTITNDDFTTNHGSPMGISLGYYRISPYHP